jgi:hypothetical protein
MNIPTLQQIVLDKGFRFVKVKDLIVPQTIVLENSQNYPDAVYFLSREACAAVSDYEISRGRSAVFAFEGTLGWLKFRGFAPWPLRVETSQSSIHKFLAEWALDNRTCNTCTDAEAFMMCPTCSYLMCEGCYRRWEGDSLPRGFKDVTCPACRAQIGGLKRIDRS